MSVSVDDMFVIFQSTLPVRGATLCRRLRGLLRSISIHAPRAGSDFGVQAFIFRPYISIHAPRAGSDCYVAGLPRKAKYFNPRSPCGERLVSPLHLIFTAPFQSTLPVRGATDFTFIFVHSRLKFQSTLPVRGATDPSALFCGLVDISIHAPRAGSDCSLFCWLVLRCSYFNPRSPCGERRVIGVLLTGLFSNFNPRSPCGERLTLPSCQFQGFQFQSTLPVRGATEDFSMGDAFSFISIHAPRAGSDSGIRTISGWAINFNPRSPCGERPMM